MGVRLSREVIGCAIAVHRVIGFGFREAVYGNALALELESRHIQFSRQHPVQISYRNHTVGKLFLDLLIEDQLLVELKATESLNRIHQAQVTNYLNATNLNVALLLNFGTTTLQIKRLVHQYQPSKII